jgi:hypothetical protein
MREIEYQGIKYKVYYTEYSNDVIIDKVYSGNELVYNASEDYHNKKYDVSIDFLAGILYSLVK